MTQGRGVTRQERRVTSPTSTPARVQHDTNTWQPLQTTNTFPESDLTAPHHGGKKKMQVKGGKFLPTWLRNEGKKEGKFLPPLLRKEGKKKGKKGRRRKILVTSTESDLNTNTTLQHQHPFTPPTTALQPDLNTPHQHNTTKRARRKVTTPAHRKSLIERRTKTTGGEGKKEKKRYW